MTDPCSQSEHAVLMAGVAREVTADDGQTRRLLADIDLAVACGGLMHIVGPSGSGKSSLIRLINRLDEAAAGRIDVLGRAIADWPPRQLRRRVAMVFQEPMLLEMNVERNLRLPFDLNGGEPDDLDERMRSVLEQVGLSAEMLDRRADQLSVGQKQRVTLARALITEPDVLLLDEPTSSLDPRTAEDLLDQVAAVRQQRSLTIVMVTHRLSEAQRMGGDLTVLIDGRIAATGPVDELIDHPPSDEVGRFLHGENHGTD